MISSPSLDLGLDEGFSKHLVDATMFWNPSGGVHRYIVAKHRWTLRHTSWRHTIATPMPDGPDQLIVPSVPLPGSHGDYRLPLRRAEAARRLRAARPDLIEAADPYRLAWAALDAAQALGVPAIAFCHSNLEQVAATLWAGPGAALAQRAARRYAAHLYRHFDLVLAPSRAMADHLREWGVAEVAHQPLGVDTSAFHPCMRSAEWRATLGLPPGARLLIFAGRFAPEKNLATLCEAVHRLGPRYWLLAIGAGPRPPAGERVIVLPPAQHTSILATALASADVFVHAGAHETFGLAVLEAMACGVPVAERQIEGLAELVDASVGQGATGDTAADFANAIVDVFERGPERLGLAARRRAEQFDWEQVFPRLWDHYANVLGKRNPVATPAG